MAEPTEHTSVADGGISAAGKDAAAGTDRNRGAAFRPGAGSAAGAESCRAAGSGNVLRVGRGGAEVDLSRGAVMTILNLTPDSFWEGSRTPGAVQAARRAEAAAEAGAAILDVGGYSSRPGAAEVPPQEEWRRVRAGLEAARRGAPGLPVSVDTFRAEVMRRALEEFGPCMVNDIYGGASAELVRLAARWEVPYIAMHMRGTPATMQSMTDYPDGVAAEVARWGRRTAARLEAEGVRGAVLDPGFGFAKSAVQNYELLAGLPLLVAEGRPVLAGVSRKSMIYKPLGITPAEALPGTGALCWEALRQGARILRVHDTAEAVQVLRVFGLYAAARMSCSFG